MMNNCPICGKIANLEGHHITPISYGGDKNGELVFICEACHFNIHKTAESILAKTVNSKNWFNDEALLKKAAFYIQAIIKAKRNYQEGNVSQDLRKRRLIIVELSDFEWKRLHKLEKDKGFNNLTTFIQNMLIGLTKF